jgi:hypothetical protein
MIEGGEPVATLLDNNALADGIFVGIAVMLAIGAFTVMFNGALSQTRDK